MTKRHALGRHRATPVRTNPLESISKAVSSNAGSVGRQAAVVAAASGLVLSIGVPAQATPATREASHAPATDVLQADRVASVTTATVTVPAAKKSAQSAIKVASIKDATDGSAYRAAKRAERKAAAERQEAAEEAAAERAEAREAAAERAEAREAAAERRQAAAQREAASAQSSTTSSSSSSSSSSSNSTPSSSSGNNSGSRGSVTTASSGGNNGSGSNGNSSGSGSDGSKSDSTASSKGSSNKEAAISWALSTAANDSIGYVFGANGPSNYDCSSFVQSAFAKNGISVARNSGGQASGGTRVPISQLKRGDLVFSANGGGVYHVAIYLGGGQVVHARNPASGISTTSLSYINNMVSYGVRY